MKMHPRDRAKFTDPEVDWTDDANHAADRTANNGQQNDWNALDLGDWLDTKDVSDTVCAGSGNDHVFSGSDDDRVDVQSGNDVIWLKGNSGDSIDVAFGGTGDDTIYGGDGIGQLQGEADNAPALGYA